MIRQGCDQAYIELVFSVDSEAKAEALRALDVTPDGDGLVIVSKKITPVRSISRINDETVTAAKLRQVTGLLIDIHGQHEHQSLLYHARHLEILDEYAKSRIHGLKENTAALYGEYTRLNAKLKSPVSYTHLDVYKRQEQILTDRKHRLALLSGRLHGQSPLQKLSRGFGFVTDPEGRRMVSVEQAEPGQQIEVRLTDGKLRTQVTGKERL